MSEWKKVRLGEVAELIAGYAFKSKCFGDYNSKVIKITDINNEGFFCAALPGVDISQLDKKKLDKYLVKRGDYVLAMTGSIGKIGKLLDGMAYINQRVLTVKAFENTDRKYLYFCLKGKPFLEYMLTHIDSHSVQANISASTIGDFELTLPPLPTQRKIAAVLGALDDKIENNRKICANLEAQAQAIFKNSDRRSDAVPFTALIKILSGGTPKTSEPSYWGGDIPFFSPKDVGEPYAIYTERTITKDGLDSCNSGFYPKDTTFVTARGTVGKVCLAGVPMAMNQSCFALASDSIDPLLVYSYTKASIDSLKSKANGSVFDAITIAEFETERIARLKESEEREFVNIVRPMFDKILSLSFESRSLAAMRDALLPKLMSGEIDVELR